VPGSLGVVRAGPAIWSLGILCTLIEQCVPPGERSELYPQCILPTQELEITGQTVTFANWTGVLLPYRAMGFHPPHMAEKGRPRERHKPRENHLLEHRFEGSWWKDKTRRGPLDKHEER
jgi:hypothetical protein